MVSPKRIIWGIAAWSLSIIALISSRICFIMEHFGMSGVCAEISNANNTIRRILKMKIILKEVYYDTVSGLRSNKPKALFTRDIFAHNIAIKRYCNKTMKRHLSSNFFSYVTWKYLSLDNSVLLLSAVWKYFEMSS